jgi:hypothetical protein
MEVDYLPDEESRAFYDKDADCPNSFQKGWRAACEAMAAKIDKLEADLHLAGENTKSDQAYILNLGIENARLRAAAEAARCE